MRGVVVRVMLPTFVVGILLILLAVMGRTTQSPLKIAIHTDFECGACGKLHSEVEPELREQYVATGQAQIEIRLLGAMDSVCSMRAGQAALCAGDQGRFLEYQDALFRA